MGRTAPSTRILVEAEIDRLRRVASRLRDPRDREALEEIIEYTYRVLDAYRFEAMADPLEPIIIAGLLYTARSCRGREKPGIKAPHDK